MLCLSWHNSACEQMFEGYKKIDRFTCLVNIDIWEITARFCMIIYCLGKFPESRNTKGDFDFCYLYVSFSQFEKGNVHNVDFARSIGGVVD